MDILLSIIYLSCLSWTTHATPLGDSMPKPNHGVVFTPLPQMILADRSSYDLVFSIPRPQHISEDIPRCGPGSPRMTLRGSSTPADWCSVFSRKELGIVSALLTDIATAQAGIDALLHSPVQPDVDARSPRAPYWASSVGSPDHSSGPRQLMMSDALQEYSIRWSTRSTDKGMQHPTTSAYSTWQSMTHREPSPPYRTKCR